MAFPFKKDSSSFLLLSFSIILPYLIVDLKLLQQNRNEAWATKEVVGLELMNREGRSTRYFSEFFPLS